ncbi:phosphate acyltransferase [Sedimentibacter sp.]|uniref:phosphate acyltransferase n=1 Tax=Sedimentibacter sp. TaxID=1960295 RepID=UPI002897A8EF|nr:phosphate acyltransferase [Sedimentibacter sp.]
MIYKSLDDIVLNIKKCFAKKRMVVAGADEEHTLSAVSMAKKEGIISAVLVGDAGHIKEILNNIGEDSSEYEIIHNTENPVDIAVQLIRENKADILMKGNVQTATLIKAVLNKDTGIMKGELLSHILFVQAPAYHKIFAVTDSAIIPNPNLEQKKAILENAVTAMLSLGYDTPKAAALTAVEVVNPKMQETVDADELKKLNKDNKIKNCIVEGPISMDIAFDKEAGKIKGFTSDILGEPDILLMPNLLVGNIAVKALRIFGQSTVAGLVIGASVPIVLTSRSTSTKSKYMSIAMSAAIAPM